MVFIDKLPKVLVSKILRVSLPTVMKETSHLTLCELGNSQARRKFINHCSKENNEVNLVSTAIEEIDSFITTRTI